MEEGRGDGCEWTRGECRGIYRAVLIGCWVASGLGNATVACGMGAYVERKLTIAAICGSSCSVSEQHGTVCVAAAIKTSSDAAAREQLEKVGGGRGSRLHQLQPWRAVLGHQHRGPELPRTEPFSLALAFVHSPPSLCLGLNSSLFSPGWRWWVVHL